jgi:hypothetical protein
MPGSQHLGHRPGSSDAASENKWGIAVGEFTCDTAGFKKFQGNPETLWARTNPATARQIEASKDNAAETASF